jgi:hypothetical protein
VKLCPDHLAPTPANDRAVPDGTNARELGCSEAGGTRSARKDPAMIATYERLIRLRDEREVRYSNNDDNQSVWADPPGRRLGSWPTSTRKPSRRRTPFGVRRPAGAVGARPNATRTRPPTERPSRLVLAVGNKPAGMSVLSSEGWFTDLGAAGSIQTKFLQRLVQAATGTCRGLAHQSPRHRRGVGGAAVRLQRGRGAG